MRGVPLLVAIVLALVAGADAVSAQQKPGAGSKPALAPQSGTIQITSASQIATGDELRRGRFDTWEPDLGVLITTPPLRSATLHADVHVVRRDDGPRLGRALFSARGLQAGGFSWNIDGGDSSITPSLTQHGFNNLFAPQVTFRGGSLSAANPVTSFSFSAGRTTVRRNIFGSDAETLGQSMIVGSVSHKPSARVELVGRASRIRTNDLKEYSYLVRSSDEFGGGIRFKPRPSLQLVADAGYSGFRRVGSNEWESQPSALLGARWAASRGWLQVNAHRFSTGGFTTLNYPYNDREGIFAAGEYDLVKEARVYGGWDMFRTNLDPEASARSSRHTSEGRGMRAYAGARFRLGAHVTAGLRTEDGARAYRYSRYTTGVESDTGLIATNWQVTAGRWNATLRYDRRSNVDVSDGLQTYTQHDAAAHAFYSLGNGSQVYASWTVTRRIAAAGGGESFVQGTGGVNIALRQNLQARAEGIFSRNAGIRNAFHVPRAALSLGLVGQLSRQVSVAVDTLIDRTPIARPGVSPWLTRTFVRLVYTAPFGSPSVRGKATGGSGLRAGTSSGSIWGSVFVDWNGNGVCEPGEEPVEGVRVVTDDAASGVTQAEGGFALPTVATGQRIVSLDLTTVSADYDPPFTSGLTVEVAKARRAEAAFGLVPLGRIDGLVYEDVNANKTFDEGDRPVDNAVVILDAGSRTEVTRQGRYRFDGVRIGLHKVELLVESLPETMSADGTPRVEVELAREKMLLDVDFALKPEKRPEVRKVFPPKK